MSSPVPSVYSNLFNSNVNKLYIFKTSDVLYIICERMFNITLPTLYLSPATQYNSTAVVGWLLKQTKLCGREVDDMGATPLHLACELGHVTLVRAFVRRYVVFCMVFMVLILMV